MLNYKIQKAMLAVLTAGMLGLGSCDKGFDEMNIDPNKPTEVPAQNLLTQAQLDLNQLFWGTAVNAEFSMLLVQHFAQNEYAEESRYTLSGANFNGIWSNAYAGGLNDLKVAADLVREDETLTEEVRANRLAILEIMQVWTFHNLTDIFGAIPYSEAFGEDPTPAYDSQEFIYNDLLTRLDEVVATIKVDAESFPFGENIYNGDMEQWKLLANTLKLRIAMRMSDVAPGVAGAAVQEAYNAGVILSHANAATYDFNSQAALANPLYINRVINNRDDYSVAKTLLDTMKANDDPRISAYAKPNVDGEYEGMPYGVSDAAATDFSKTSSRPNDDIRQQQSEAIIAGPVEVYFLLAEAAQRGFIAGDAAGFYESALELSMEQWGVNGDDYIEAHPYDAANWKEVIGEQKWVALYTQGLQAWSEWRRLDYPVLPFPEAANPEVSSIPVRAFYPADEEGVNNESLKAAGPNDLSTNLWWDVD
jgi:hypothetical protein